MIITIKTHYEKEAIRMLHATEWVLVALGLDEFLRGKIKNGRVEFEEVRNFLRDKIEDYGLSFDEIE